MAKQVFANNASSVLTTGINTSATTLVLTDGSMFPSPTAGDFFHVALVGLNVNGQENAWEVVKCTARSGNNLTVIRAQEGTVAASWGVATRVEVRLTAEFANTTGVHLVDTTNPHAVTATQVGLGNVDNTSDATKNAATATLTNKTLTNPSYSGATANGGTVTTIDINGGTIDGTVIGGAVPAAGSFTTVNAASSAASQGVFNGWNAKSGVNGSNGQLNVGTTTSGARIMGDAAGTGGTVIDDLWDNASSSIKLRLRGAGTPVDSATFTSTGLNSTVIGATTPAAGAFTSLSVSGATPTLISTMTYVDEWVSGLLTPGTSTWSLKSGTVNGAGGVDRLTINNVGAGTFNGPLSVTGAVSATGALTTAGLKEDASGNLGLGVTPSAWHSVYRALQLPGGAYIAFSGMYGTLSANAYFNTSGVDTYTANGYALRYGQLGDTHAWFTAPSGTAGNAITFTQAMTLDASGILSVPGIYANTTASAANTFVDTDGTLKRSTSSIKYKTDVETLQSSYADSIYQMRPVWYRSKCDGDNAGWSWYGLIAEEVAAIDPRLVHWAYPMKTVEDLPAIDAIPAVLDEGVEIKPEVPAREATIKQVKDTDAAPIAEGMQYERLTVLLISVAQKQKQQIDSLLADKAQLLTVLASVDNRLLALESA